MSLRTNLVVIVLAAVVAGCGDDAADTAGTITVPPPSATPPGAPPTTTPTPGSTPAATVTPTPTPEPAATEEGGGEEEGGDEEGNRTELRIDLLPRGIQPARVEVPAFLGLRIRVENQTSQPQPVILDGKPLGVIGPRQGDRFDAEGLRPGDHVLEAGRSGRATIVAVRAGG